MVNQQLMNYIQTQSESGYTYDQIGNFLLQQGYAQRDVRSAIKTLTKTPLDKKTLIQRIVIAIMVLLISYMVYYNYFLN